MSDPSNSRVVPDRSTIELALRVAEKECAGVRPGSYWHGAAAALRWALGLRAVSPVSERHVVVDLDDAGRRPVRSEAETTYELMSGGTRRADVPGMRYLTGVENTCMWIVNGSGFAHPL